MVRAKPLLVGNQAAASQPPLVCALCAGGLCPGFVQLGELWVHRCSACCCTMVSGEIGPSGEQDSPDTYASRYSNEARSGKAQACWRLLEHRSGPLRPGRRFLDVGSGEGAFLDLAREHGHQTAGIEISPSAAAAAMARGHTVYVGSVLDPGVGEAGSYDIVTLWDVLEHIREPRRVLAAAFRLLAPGGTLALVTPMMGSLFDRAGVRALRLSRGRWDALARMCWSREHVFRFEPSGLVGALSSLGFREVEAKPILLLSLRASRYAGGQILPRWTRSSAINGAISRAGVAVVCAIRIPNKVFVVATKPRE